MVLRSNRFQCIESDLFKIYMDGADASPDLTWQGAPERTESSHLLSVLEKTEGMIHR